jgi:tetratricopeptide (TPR) repeat protein
MLTNKVLVVCAATTLLAGVVTVGGCSRSPQARELRFLKRGKDLVAQKDLGRALLEFKSAAQAMPKDAEPYYQLGLTYLAIRDHRYAIAAFRKAVELDPKHAGAELKLAEMEANSRNRDLLGAAMARLHLIVASSPDNLEAVNALAIAEWRLGETDTASKLLEETLQKFPANLRSAISLERMKLRQKDVSGAEAVLQKAAASAPQSPLPVLALGQLYVILNQSEKAEGAFRKALLSDPKSGPALLGLAALQLAANQTDAAEQSLRQLASIPDTKYESVHAIFLYQTGKRDAALAEFERIVKDHPDDRTARTRLLQVYLEMNKLPQAENLLAAVLKKNPKDVDALLQRSKLYLRAGRIQEAQRDLNQVIHFEPNAIPAHLALAAVYGAQGMAQAERQELSEALRLNPALPQSRLLLATNLLAGNEPASALRLLDEAPDPQKKTLLWTVERNRVLLALRKTPELRESLGQVLPYVRLPEFVLQDALLKLAEHDYTGARASAEEVLRQNAEDGTAARIVADAYFAQKQPDKAVERLAQMVAAHPNSAPLQDLLGEWCLRTGNAAAARKAWMAAKTADARFFHADLALAELDRRENHADQARQRLLSVVKTAPSDIPALMALARIDEYSGNLTEAMATYRTVLNVDGQNLFALNNLAWHLALENPDEGLKLAQHAAEIAPDNPLVEDTLGWAFYRKGIYSAATRHLKEAFSKEPTPRREFHLAMSYLKSGDKDLGARMVQAALSKDPNLLKTETGW